MTRRLWLLLGGAVAVRAASAATLAVVAPDGARNLRMARLILEGDWNQALTLYPITHPLYPILVAPFSAHPGTALAAACALSAVLGGLAVLPFYFLCRRAWNDRVAAVASLLYALLPSVVELHGDAMLEGAFMFFFFAAMALGWSALEEKSWERAVLAGASTALAWLTRPEGIYLPILLVLACLLRPGRFAPAAAALALATAWVLALPYQGFVKAQTGAFGASASPFSAGILGLVTGKTPARGYQVDEKSAAEFAEYRDIQRYGRVGGPVVTLSKAVLKIHFYVIAPFVLLGFGFLKSQDMRWGPCLYLLAAVGGYFLPAILAFVAGTPFSHRYILVPCVLLLPVAALGLLKAAEWARHRHALPAFLALVCLGMAVRDVTPRRRDKIGMKLAGQTILRELGPDRKILAMSRPIEFYARGQFVEFLPGATFADVERLAEAGAIDAVALQVSDFRNVESGMEECLERRFRRVGEYPSPARKGQTPVRLYAVR
jgi:4-amino-4-deoxy-L-arabinose transferase-like glycosyltransferase